MSGRALLTIADEAVFIRNSRMTFERYPEIMLQSYRVIALASELETTLANTIIEMVGPDRAGIAVRAFASITAYMSVFFLQALQFSDDRLEL